MAASALVWAQLLTPLVEELIPVIAGIFAKHAPQAGQSVPIEVAKENFAADATDPVKEALTKALMTMPPAPEQPKKTGVVFHGNEPRPI